MSWPDASGWRLNEDSGRLYLLGVGHVKLRLHRRLPGRPKTATVNREARRWWVVVQCDRVEPKALPATGAEVGIDLGVASVLTTSDGNHTANPRSPAGPPMAWQQPSGTWPPRGAAPSDAGELWSGWERITAGWRTVAGTTPTSSAARWSTPTT